MPTPDRDLVRCALAGDTDAFATLVERYTPLVHGIILERLRRPDEVDDLVQETFVRAFEGLASLRDPGRFGPWLGRTAANVTFGWLRQQRLRTVAEGQPVLRVGATPDELFERDEAADLLWQALDRIDPEIRRIVVLHYVEDCSQRQIARFLGLALPTIKWRLFRARALLHEELAHLHGRRLSARSRGLGRYRERAMSALPLLPFLRLPPPTWRPLLRVAGAGAALAGVAGLGLAIDARLDALAAASAARLVDELPLSVRYEPQALPAVAIVTRPPRPRAGQSVEIEIAGLDPDGDAPYLHYVTDLEGPVDRVVAMERDGEAWVARVPIPPEAVGICFHTSPDPDPDPLPVPTRIGDPSRFRQLQRYDHALAVHGADGQPVRGAHALLATWAFTQGLGTDRVLAYYEEELRNHPDNYRIQSDRLGLLQWNDVGGELARRETRVRRERARLAARYADDPALLWATREVGHDGNLAWMQDFVRRFPDDEHAAAAAYTAAISRDHDPSHDPATLRRAWIANLRQFLVDHPRSEHVPGVWRDLLFYYDRQGDPAALALADSLLDGTLVPGHDPATAHATERISRVGPWFGLYPISVAYSLRLRAHLAAGDTAAILDLGRHLLASDLDDPIPYLHLADSLRFSAVAQALAVRLLERAAPLTTVEHMTTLTDFRIDPNLPAGRRKWELNFALRHSTGRWRAHALRALGAYHLGAGRLAAAAPLLEEALQLQEFLPRFLDDLNAEPYHQLARTYLSLDRCRDAARTYQRLLAFAHDDTDATRQLRRLYDRGCGEPRLTAEQAIAATWPLAPDICGPTRAPAAADTLCLRDLAGAPVLLYHDAAAPQGDEATEFRRLQAWTDRYGARGLRVLHAAQDWVAQDTSGTYRRGDRLFAAMAGGGYTFRSVSSTATVWRDSAQYAASGFGRTLYLVDARGRLRLRQSRNWDDAVRSGQDGQVDAVIERLLAEARGDDVAALAPR